MAISISDFRKAVKQSYTWPGGYKITAILDNGGVLCDTCLKTERRDILEALKDPSYRSGWEIAGFDVLWEGPDTYCDHCNTPMSTEYGNPKGD